jgi:MoaA/NifB/PqqE/SkfB family radical SAM enzyme
VLEAKTMILDENAEDLLAIHKYCMEKLHCDHHSFQFLKGSPIQHADIMFDFKDILEKSSAYVYRKFQTIVEQLELIKKYNVETGAIGFLHPKIASLTTNETIPNIEFMNDSDFHAEKFMHCKFPWSSVHINSDGHLFPCLAISMGNVKEKKLTEIIWSEEYNKFKEIIREKGTVEACNRCGWLRQINSLT